ncbi:hypothetical protein SANT12839_002330 [Streptomyces antimycoticus]|uniref:Transketolase-like pyrimidine-binding domain-containing protein n=1 Tax=Streptomyces antimycoticus TaxID=68175 RepID=A0A4D4JRJ9_9ACTN|nr:hypothetical protein SANT12839_002330 [Streptomyces antimycoticus]
MTITAAAASATSATSPTPNAQDKAATTTLGRALNEGLRQAMRDDERVVLLGEDIASLGGVFRVTDGLAAEFGDRVVDTPLAESGIIGTAIGLALRGYRPVCEIQFDGFVYPAFDQIVSQLAKMRARSRGLLRLPVTIRIPVGAGSARSSTTASRMRRTSATRPDCAS